MPIGYTVYKPYERVHGRFTGTIAMAEEVAKSSCYQVFHEKDPAAIGQNHWFRLRQRSKKDKADWIRHGVVESLVSDQLLGAVEQIGAKNFKHRRDVVLPQKPNACASWGFCLCSVVFLRKPSADQVSCVEELKHLVKSCYLKNQVLAQLGVEKFKKPRPTSCLSDFVSLHKPSDGAASKVGRRP